MQLNTNTTGSPDLPKRKKRPGTFEQQSLTDQLQNPGFQDQETVLSHQHSDQTRVGPENYPKIPDYLENPTVLRAAAYKDIIKTISPEQLNKNASSDSPTVIVNPADLTSTTSEDFTRVSAAPEMSEVGEEVEVADLTHVSAPRDMRQNSAEKIETLSSDDLIEDEDYNLEMPKDVAAFLNKSVLVGQDAAVLCQLFQDKPSDIELWQFAERVAHRQLISKYFKKTLNYSALL